MTSKTNFDKIDEDQGSPKVPYDILIEEFITPDTITDSESIYKLKSIISNLPLPDKYILLLYLDSGSYRSAANLIDVSPSVFYYRTSKIIKKIKDAYDNC